MRRREFISLIGGVAATWPLAAQAQQPALPVVGLLRTTEAPEWIAAFRRGLSDSGYTEGNNVTLDIRVAEGKRDQLSELSADLVRKRVAAIVANTNATPYVISATKSIPIVFVTDSDPVAAGFVPMITPTLVKPAVMAGTGFLGAHADDDVGAEVDRDVLALAAGASLVVVTHDPNVAAWCSRRIDMRDGRVVVERTFGRPVGLLPAMSVTKSIVSLAVGLLLHEGKIPSLDASLGTWFPEWRTGPRAQGLARGHAVGVPVRGIAPVRGAGPGEVGGVLPGRPRVRDPGVPG